MYLRSKTLAATHLQKSVKQTWMWHDHRAQQQQQQQATSSQNTIKAYTILSKCEKRIHNIHSVNLLSEQNLIIVFLCTCSIIIHSYWNILTSDFVSSWGWSLLRHICAIFITCSNFLGCSSTLAARNRDAAAIALRWKWVNEWNT